MSCFFIVLCIIRHLACSNLFRAFIFSFIYFYEFYNFYWYLETEGTKLLTLDGKVKKRIGKYERDEEFNNDGLN